MQIDECAEEFNEWFRSTQGNVPENIAMEAAAYWTRLGWFGCWGKILEKQQAYQDDYEALEFEKNQLESENEILIQRIAKLEIARESPPVSLKEATDAVYQAALNRAIFSDARVHDTQEFSQNLAEAALRAADVQYE